MGMPYHCGVLLPQVERYLYSDFRQLARWFNPLKGVSRELLLELTIFLQTPGLTQRHYNVFFKWPNKIDSQLKLLEPLVEEACELVPENVKNQDLADGERMLRCLLEHCPSFGSEVPHIVEQMLRERRRRGQKASDIAREFGTSVEKVRRWWKQDFYDPLTMLRRDTARTRPGANLRILGV